MLIDTLPSAQLVELCNSNQVRKKRRDMYATQSLRLLHSFGVIHIHIF